MITLDKAIEVLEDLMTTSPQWPPDDRREGVQLGIEALRRIKAGRDTPSGLSFIPLKGEDIDWG